MRPRSPRRKYTATFGNPLDRLEPRWMPSADVLTYHNNNMRTSFDDTETTLTPSIEETLDGISTTYAEQLKTLKSLNFQQFKDVSLMAA